MTIPRGPSVLLGLGVVLLLDVLRVFLPSLITLFGRAGETPAELMGLYAALWFALPLLAVPLRPRWSLVGGAAALVLARVGMQAFDGGSAQLYLSSAGVSVGLVFLYGCARTLPRAAVPSGLAGGLACSVVIHLLLGNVDLVWRDGVLPWLAVLTVCAAFLLSVRHALLSVRPAPTTPGDLAPGTTWFLLGPAMLLIGMFATTPMTGDTMVSAWSQGFNGVTAAFAILLLPLMTDLLIREPRLSRGSAVLAAGLVLAGVLLSGWLGGSSVLLPVGLGIALAVTVGFGGVSRRPGAGLLGGMALFLVTTFLYYAAYDLDLGFPNTVVPVAVALLVAVITLMAARRGPDPAATGGPLRFRPVAVAGVGVLALALLVGVVSARPVPAVQAKEGDTFTLIAYNVRMGFGLDGRLSLDKIAAWAASKKPDVVLLSEVDRGWLLNGGHDGLERIAQGLGMGYYFAPAADPLWGDALLTNLPVKQVTSHPLGAHDYPTGAQAQAIVLEVGGGEAGGKEVGIVNTHLQAPPGQAPEVAAIVRDLARSRPVLLAGDLNITPADPEMRVLESAGLADPLIALGDPPTSPADAPTKRIDHVLLGEGLTAVSAEVARVPHSDHLPVVVTLRITSVDQEG